MIRYNLLSALLIILYLVMFVRFMAHKRQKHCFTSNSSTLSDVFSCIVQNMPRYGHFNKTRPYTIPNEAQVHEWRRTVDKMLRMTDISECDRLERGLSMLKNVYVVRSLKSDGKKYCLLMESQSADKNNVQGWGTFVVKVEEREPLSRVDLHLSAAHPLTDGYVEVQGIEIFAQSPVARSFLLAGTVRTASQEYSTCQTNYFETDVAHNVDNLFHQTVVQTGMFYNVTRNIPKLVHLQLHGMKETSCPDVTVYMTVGVAVKSDLTKDNTFTWLMRALIENTGNKWNITTFGTGSQCNLSGTTNVQGRLLNVISFYDLEYATDVCKQSVANASGSFIHIEQKMISRDASNIWIKTINDAWLHSKRKVESRL